MLSHAKKVIRGNCYTHITLSGLLSNVPEEPIVIVAERRMSNFVAGLTNDNPTVKAPVFKQYHHVQYNGTVQVSATATVNFPPSDEEFRYVIIQKQFPHTEAICITEVQVFVRGRFYMFCVSCEK